MIFKIKYSHSASGNKILVFKGTLEEWKEYMSRWGGEFVVLEKKPSTCV